ncbi:MAG: ABC transporter ATP-binding protein [Verrucomicrobia bacterium]|nr:ABC transporter ATP-binding protein [Verrucomicrobiota bacterium]MCF7707426.1 ABC transporter ATP-binding protein [Verrucomicrobiota bacterium]
MKSVIEAKELSRWYGIVMGLNHVSFDIGGGLTGLVGPNGAGKSTLIQIITGQIQPSSGSLTVFGERPWNNPSVLRRIGYCPESTAVARDLRPFEWLRGLGMISGWSSKDSAASAERVLEMVRLPRVHWNKRLAQYSKGMRQRVKLAQALLHEPELLVLDEPLNGLDPMGRQEMGRLFKDLCSQGVSIVISSHILEELESLCKWFLMLNWGRVVASGTRDAIQSGSRRWDEQLLVRCDRPERLARCLFDEELLRGFYLEPGNGAVSFHIKEPEEFYENWLNILERSGVTVYEIRSGTRSLSSIFAKVTE